MAEPFAAIEEVRRFTGEIVRCMVTTVDAQCWPRSRIMRPLFQVLDARPVGWVLTNRPPVKTRHVTTSPAPPGARRRIRSLPTASPPEWRTPRPSDASGPPFSTTPPPLRYGLSGNGSEGPRAPPFTPLRPDPWRVEV